MAKLFDDETRAPVPAGARTIEEVAAAATECRACPLWENATQTVFGEGPDDNERAAAHEALVDDLRVLAKAL